ncbi:MAG: hypothetical protein Tsb0034_23850 [Ekhidna sp.]
MNRYYSEVSKLTKWLLWGSLGLTWISLTPVLLGEESTAFWTISLFIGGFTIFIASIYFNTYYTFDHDYLVWVTGPFKGKIKISEIKVVKRARSIWEITSSIKPILSDKPLLLRYSRYDDLPVSPKNERAFLKELLRVNPNIDMRPIKISASDQPEA